MATVLRAVVVAEGRSVTYVLAVLSHGAPGSPTLRSTLDSFAKHVTPKPEFSVYMHDGPGVADFAGGAAWYMSTPERVGFCDATRQLWDRAVTACETAKVEHVFWLEHDFLFVRDVNIEHMRAALDGWPDVAQLALMRQHFPHEFPGIVPVERRQPVLGYEELWFVHRQYFTTNPSLMRADFMRENPWPHYPSECEGKFGTDLVGRGYRFGVWGDGEAWVEHTGKRSGHGY